MTYEGGDEKMSSKKAIGGSLAAIIILMLSQTLAQLIASVLVLVKVPEGICNMIAGVLYVGLAFGIMKIFTEKIMKVGISDLGMPQFAMKGKWILVAVLLPLVVKGTYLLFFHSKLRHSQI